MANDREILIICDVNESFIRNINTYKRRKSDNSYYSYMYYKDIKESNIYIEYKIKHRRVGDLRISFNPTKLQITRPFTVESLIKVLTIEVMEAIDLENLIYYNSIKVSKDETCINILLPKENIASVINAISKMNIQHYKVDNEYLSNGTVSFYTGKSPTSTGIKLRVYDKTKELSEKGVILDELKLNGMAILRIEMVSKRAKIRREFNKQRKFTFSSTLNMNVYIKKQQIDDDYNKVFSNLSGITYFNKVKPMTTSNLYFNVTNAVNNVTDKVFSQFKIICIRKKSNLEELEYMMYYGYEHSVFYSLVNRLHLNSRIVTRKKLFKKIERTNKLSSAQKASARMVIRYLNKEQVREEISEYNIKKYSRFILSLGYHYIYAGKEIGRLIIGDISLASNIVDINDYILSYDS
ncbi:hypothetical protein [Clostridium estertheticum]|uniref:hypothetical protein n=1 Tax=Clostridium estertheticum TaxID=238834 RepID=UPI001C7D7277|nr:hypothetical protein [Clostridium estertheticum]MBX4271982.1 hypothetical protein [Clostridium estertheticum]WLC80749.1 hypothetical protein KTC98_05555 [Clostridium estertheticum]